MVVTDGRKGREEQSGLLTFQSQALAGYCVSDMEDGQNKVLLGR